MLARLSKILWSLVICKCFPENGRSRSPTRSHIDIKDLLHKSGQYESRRKHIQLHQSDPALFSCTSEKVLLFSCSLWPISGWAAAKADGKWQPFWYLCHQTWNWERTIWRQSSFGALYKVIHTLSLFGIDEIILHQGFTDGRLLLRGWLSGGCLVWVEERSSSGMNQNLWKGGDRLSIDTCFSDATVATTSSWLTMTHWTQASRLSLVGASDQA